MHAAFNRLAFHQSDIDREAREEKGVNISYNATSTEVSSTIEEIKAAHVKVSQGKKKK